jgi:hypothetical protein
MGQNKSVADADRRRIWRAAAFTAGILCVIAQLACATVTSQNKSSANTMEPNQSQQKLDHIQVVMNQEWDGSSDFLNKNAADEPEEFRRDLYALYWRFGTASADGAKRRSIVDFFVGKINEETPMLRGQLLKWLQDFRKEDFGDKAKIHINSLPWLPEYVPEAIRLIGVAEARDGDERLRTQIREHPLEKTPGYEKSATWAALLALARLGDRNALAQVIDRVNQEKNIVVRASILLYDLGFTRRPAAFDTLKKYINSEERLPRIKDNVPGRQEASHAAAVFSKYIKDFPIIETDFNEQQTRQAREWVNSRTAWEFK